MTIIEIKNIALWNNPTERITLRTTLAQQYIGTSIDDYVAHNDNATYQNDTLVIDGSDFILAPGFADPHVHFRDPGQRYKETMITGSRSAVAGGFTAVAIMPNTLPALDGEVADPNEEGYRDLARVGANNALDYICHYGDYMRDELDNADLLVDYVVAVCASRDRAGQEASDPECWERFTHMKNPAMKHPVVAISDDGSAVPTPILEEVLRHAQAYNLVFLEHCEHHDTGVMNEGVVSERLQLPGVPASTELAIVARDIDFCRKTGVPVHLQHVSTALAFEAVRQAKAEGLPVTCETAPHYCALSDEAIEQYGTFAKMNPPLRTELDRQATLQAIADGTVDMLATDHAPHSAEEKAQGMITAPNGIIGLETAYPVAHELLVQSGLISEQRLIELMAVNPRRLLQYSDSEIAITPRYDEQHNVNVVDTTQKPLSFTLLAPQRKVTIDAESFYSHGRNTPFNHQTYTGAVVGTIVHSQLVFSNF